MAAKLTSTIVLGEGRLGWVETESNGDRWGTIYLTDEASDYQTFDNVPEGMQARLVIVIKPDSRHGAPRGTHVLGRGVVFTELYAGRIPLIGVEPADGRPRDWLDFHVMNECHRHNAIVRLEARRDR